MTEQPADVWGLGSYEKTAAELMPAAEVAVGALKLREDERVLDVACGSGNAAAVAAGAGARVSGLDGSARLVEVAQARIPGGEFVVGDATDMPYDEAAFDAAVSVFGLIFAVPAERAAAEVARVVRPGGRIAITSWPPRGALFEAISLMRRTMARVRPDTGPPRANWGDPEVVRGLLEPYGELEITEHELPVDASDPEERWERMERHHPMFIASRSVLEPAGEWEGLREASLTTLRRGRAETAPYLLSVLTRA